MERERVISPALVESLISWYGLENGTSQIPEGKTRSTVIQQKLEAVKILQANLAQGKFGQAYLPEEVRQQYSYYEEASSPLPRKPRPPALRRQVRVSDRPADRSDCWPFKTIEQRDIFHTQLEIYKERIERLSQGEVMGTRREEGYRKLLKKLFFPRDIDTDPRLLLAYSQPGLMTAFIDGVHQALARCFEEGVTPTDVRVNDRDDMFPVYKDTSVISPRRGALIIEHFGLEDGQSKTQTKLAEFSQVSKALIRILLNVSTSLLRTNILITIDTQFLTETLGVSPMEVNKARRISD